MDLQNNASFSSYGRFAYLECHCSFFRTVTVRNVLAPEVTLGKVFAMSSKIVSVRSETCPCSVATLLSS